jgi:hypothetical protein
VAVRLDVGLVVAALVVCEPMPMRLDLGLVGLLVVRPLVTVTHAVRLDVGLVAVLVVAVVPVAANLLGHDPSCSFDLQNLST